MNCPLCLGPVEEVRRTSDSPLNREQFDAVKSGDFYCDRCRRYFWVRLEPNDNKSSHSVRTKTHFDHKNLEAT